MNFEYIVLGLSIILIILVGAYVYKNEFTPKPPPKPKIEYYHINF
jgi:hypothetical protein